MKSAIGKIYTADKRQALAVGLAASMAAVLLLSLISIVIFILIRGSSYFWPASINTIEYSDFHSGKTEQVFGQILMSRVPASTFAEDRVIEQGLEQHWLMSRVENGELIQSNEIILPTQIVSSRNELDIAELRLTDGTRAFIAPAGIRTEDREYVDLVEFSDVHKNVKILQRQLKVIRDEHLSPIHRQIAQYDRDGVALDAPARVKLLNEFEHFQRAIGNLEQALNGYQLVVRDAMGKQALVPMGNIVSVNFPNRLGFWGKMGFAAQRIWGFLTEEPKLANTAGGVFPALFGTVLMILLMTVIVTPFGVLAAIYLSEYAPNNSLTAAVRIAVSNMAGVPSIVYGVFGLGFFVYGIGGTIDSLFYSDRLPSPTFGTPGLFWASLTMALLTLPVVIVATEEGLKRVPQGLRDSSYALGATKIETIWYTVLPVASPAIMTGVILACARAAGEVAPLMLVGAVKFAPTLPVDGDFPFLHVERQFMHLGVFIYDGTFHSQVNSQGSSMMFAACLLLLVCVFGLNFVAIKLRSRLRKRYARD
ncbi:phosphate ABC transporter permease PstA [Alteromonas sp. ASW11-36]|uniref:Phosphate transport system permease protein PstA n=1 Tax=Alteromonas arenosi TaxID=3055817 RepID=A0ABT7T092_9ALTE|nr:phosphate ABC transporter permease PstA [Alteromonas sp. ASW11-36]MDM7861866.1 phosphate ABC transporter permease PstA [Alteromonas sp. ASW11-36]